MGTLQLAEAFALASFVLHGGLEEKVAGDRKFATPIWNALSTKWRGAQRKSF